MLGERRRRRQRRCRRHEDCCLDGGWRALSCGVRRKSVRRHGGMAVGGGEGRAAERKGGWSTRVRLGQGNWLKLVVSAGQWGGVGGACWRLAGRVVGLNRRREYGEGLHLLRVGLSHRVGWGHGCACAAMPRRRVGVCVQGVVGPLMKMCTLRLSSAEVRLFGMCSAWQRALCVAGVVGAGKGGGGMPPPR